MIVGEVMFFQKGMPGVKSPGIPPGFAEKHGADAAKAEPPKGFLKKDEYVALFDKVRAATIAALDKMTDADLDKDSGLGDFCPTVGKSDPNHSATLTLKNVPGGMETLTAVPLDRAPMATYVP
jgi:hypothetical protein